MEPISTFQAHDNYVFQLAFTQDGKTLISCGMDGLVKLWSVPDWQPLRTFEGHEKSVNTFSLSPDEKTLATGSTDNTVRLWSFPDGKLLHTLQDRKKVVAAVDISADGKFVAAGSYGGRAAVWTMNGEEVTAFVVSKKNLSSVTFSPDGSTLATAGLGDDIWIYSLPAGELLTTLSGHKIAIGSLNFINAGKQLFSAGYEGSVRFWNTSNWEEDRAIAMEDAGGRMFVFSGDEKHIAVGKESAVQVWSVADWELKAELSVNTKAVNRLSFSPDGKWLTVGASDKKIRVFAIS